MNQFRRIVSMILVIALLASSPLTAFAGTNNEDSTAVTQPLEDPADTSSTAGPAEVAVPSETQSQTNPTDNSETTVSTSPAETDDTDPSAENPQSDASTETGTASEPSQGGNETQAQATPSESTAASDPATEPSTEATPSESTAASDPATEPSTDATPSESTAASDPATEPSTDTTPSESTVASDPVTEPSTETAPSESTPASDPNADTESAVIWEATMAQVQLTGEPGIDLLAIAQSQLGYTESTRNFVVEGEGEDAVTYGYTRYGAWYGLPYGDWCAMFVSFCMNYAGLTNIPYGAGCQSWISNLTDQNLYYPRAGYNPAPGDIIFYDLNGDEQSDHVGIVSEVTADGYVTIEGNYADMVTYVTRTDMDEIMGFGRIAGFPELSDEMQTVYGEFVSMTDEIDPYAVSPMSIEDWTQIEATYYQRAHMWLASGYEFDFDYNGVTVTQDHITCHALIIGGEYYRAYCIDPGIQTGTNYGSVSNNWLNLTPDVRQALGLTLLYGYPNMLPDGGTNLQQYTYQVATQIILYEMRLEYRDITWPYTRTNSDIIDKIMASPTLDSGAPEYLSFDKTTLLNAYNSIANGLASHLTMPKFAEGNMTRYQNTTVEIKLTRQSDGTYKWTGTDSNGVLSAMEFPSMPGWTFTKSGNTLTITAPSTFSGSTTIAVDKTTAPDVTAANFAVFRTTSSPDSYQDIMITDGVIDPIQGYLTISVDNTSPVRLVKQTTRGSSVSGYDFKLYNATTKESWTFKTDANGVGYEATVNADGSYTITGSSTIEGFSAGTYDILEVLTNKGAGTVYPSFITIDIVNSSGTSISGDSWPKTYYAPGGTQLSDPVVATQNYGAAGTITLDNSENGNARLNDVTFSASDLGPGKTVVITINNDPYNVDATILKTSTNGSVSGACFTIYRQTSGDRWFVKTNSSGIGYESNAAFTTMSSKGFDGMTNGTYDLVENLAAMGVAGTVFPTSWKISVYNSAGTLVSTKTYTAASGQITKDSNGNACLTGITISGITKGGYVAFEINNEPTDGYLRVLKNTSTGTLLSGWKFGVYSDANCSTLVTTLTSGSNGYTSSATLTAGATYYVKEIGHTDASVWSSEYLVKDTSVKSVTITPNSTSTLTFENTFLGKLSVPKSTNTGKDLDGWTYGIYTSSSCSSSSLVATIVSDASGVATSGNLTPGTYYIKETGGSHKDDYWTLSTAVKSITVVANATTSSSAFVNTEYGRFQVKKTTNVGEYLSDWVFTAYTDSACTKIAKDRDGNNVVLTTGSTGTATSGYVLPGTYYIKETGGTYFTNSYWDVNTDVKSVVVTSGSTAGTSTTTFSQSVYGRLSIQKATNTNKDLSGWEFTVYTDSKCTTIATDATGKEVKLVTDANGYAVSNMLEPRKTYYVKETGGTNYSNAYWVSDSTVQSVYVTEMKINALSASFENVNYGRFQVKKTTNVGEYLSGWVFTAYTDSACTKIAKDKDGNNVVLTTGSTGTATSGYVLPGTYYIKETGGIYFGNEFWSNSTEVQTVDVVASKDTALSDPFSNTTYGRAKIIKTLETDGSLEGWEFKITDANGREIEGSPFKTDANGTFTTGNILPGTYTVEEILPEDTVYYCTTDNPQTITVKEMEIGDVTFTNALIPADILVEKVDSSGNPMQGVQFLLEYYDEANSSWAPVTYSDHKYVIKGKCDTAALKGSADSILTTDANGTIHYTNLYPTIKYRLTEISTQNNSTLLKTYAFEGELPYTVGNDRSFSIVVHVVNNENFTLPFTGTNELMFTAIGPMLMSFALVMSCILFIPSVSKGKKAKHKKAEKGISK